MKKVLAIVVVCLMFYACGSESETDYVNSSSGPVNDTLPLLRSKIWNLVNGPLQEHSTIVGGQCDGLQLESYRLDNARLEFRLKPDGTTSGIESRIGICQTHCGLYTLYYDNPCYIVSSGVSDGSGTNNFQMVRVNSQQFNNIILEELSGTLPWLLVGESKIITLNSTKLVIENQYYDHQLIFE